MHCPFCAVENTKVVDSRLVGLGNQIRRRRECVACKERFTTYETAELLLPRIIKSNNQRVPFDEDKLRTGMIKALEKRPVSGEQIDAAIMRIARELIKTGEREVPSSWVGKLVMAELRALDSVAYVRFASVYRRFEDVEAFRAELDRLDDSAARGPHLEEPPSCA